MGNEKLHEMHQYIMQFNVIYIWGNNVCSQCCQLQRVTMKVKGWGRYEKNSEHRAQDIESLRRKDTR